MDRKPLSLLFRFPQEFDQNTLFPRISLPVLNTLHIKLPIKKDTPAILLYCKKTAPQYNSNSLNCKKNGAPVYLHFKKGERRREADIG